MMDDKSITVYGTYWCGDCAWVRRFLDGNHIQYQWVDIDADKSGEDFVLTTNQGVRSVPTIVFMDGSILVEPNTSELVSKLGSLLTTS